MHVTLRLPFLGTVLSEAKIIYVSIKSVGRSVAFNQAADRAINNLIDAVGDKPIDRYSS